VFKKIACAAEISGAIDNPSTSLLAGCLADCLCVAAYAALSNEAARTQIHTATQKEVLAHTDAHRCTQIHTHTATHCGNQPSPLSYITQCYGYQQLLLLLPPGIAVAAACCMLLVLLLLLLSLVVAAATADT